MVNEPIDSNFAADLPVPSFPVPSFPVPSFPVVGIGASAGGLAAFEAFFSGMTDPFEPGMAFVLVQHLAPDHKSILAEILRRCTKMQVFEVEDGMLVQPNCVYIIPPDRDMAYLNGTLQLLEPSAPRGLRLPIDFFFRSLAQDRRSLAIGIVLSGTGNDGTQGIRAIKAEGGMVIVQSIESSDFDGMPRSVINTGLADYELPPEQMPAQLTAFAKHSLGRLAKSSSLAISNDESAMKKVFVLLRAQTGHDFSLYKPSTIHRRIDRRMAVHQIEGLENYVKYLQQSPTEVETLFRELLIGVTNFFRDPEVFQVLESQVIPKIFADKSPGSAIRVWVSGCSTGEEAYSIAILLVEHMEAIKANFTVQMFATDIDSRSIAIARAGLYPAHIASDITPERLARFFTLEADGSTYRIHKIARDLIVFSEQDVLKDPPFSKLDLITCRNLLIYMGLEAQKRLVPLFHYALKPERFLLLGTSEGVGEFDNLFDVLDRKAKLYRRKEYMHGLHRMSMGRFMPHQTGTAEVVQFPAKQGVTKLSTTGTKSLREITEQALLDQVIAAGILVNHQGDILYLHGRSGMFLEPSPGESGINNVLKMARQGLRYELTSSLHQAVGTRTTVFCPGISVKTNGHFTTVNLTIRPMTASAAADSSLFLVILEEARLAAPVPSPEVDADSQTTATSQNSSSTTDALIASLRAELRSKEEYLQCTIEELESSSEELKSSNEEMQAVNEELQSTNEEMETSKEELQSVNEELATVNTELQTKVNDLSRANNDMNNLLAGTGIGTVFVDHQLRIMRFTPAASSIINLILSDVGRPVAHIVSNLAGYTNLVHDVKRVLDTLVAQETEVQTIEGKNYTMRIQPYRTKENVIEGAVISFVDITDIVKTRNALSKANDLLRLAVVVRDAQDAITVQDIQGRMIAWNPGAARLYGWSEAEALEMNVRARIPESLQESELAMIMKLSRAEVIESYTAKRLNKVGQCLEVSVTSTALMNEFGMVYAIATTERARRNEIS